MPQWAPDRPAAYSPRKAELGPFYEGGRSLKVETRERAGQSLEARAR